jgi:hypothetical protein
VERELDSAMWEGLLPPSARRRSWPRCCCSLVRARPTGPHRTECKTACAVPRGTACLALSSATLSGRPGLLSGKAAHRQGEGPGPDAGRDRGRFQPLQSGTGPLPISRPMPAGHHLTAGCGRADPFLRRPRRPAKPHPSRRLETDPPPPSTTPMNPARREEGILA